MTRIIFPFLSFLFWTEILIVLILDSGYRDQAGISIPDKPTRQFLAPLAIHGS